MLRYLGRLIDFDIEGYEEFLNFQEHLEKIHIGSKTGVWDVEKILMRLTPSCEDLLIQCAYNGTVHNCTDLFEFRRTSIGFCCVFNSIRPEASTDE